MAPRLDFAVINTAALAAYPGLLERWLPNGKQRGREYVCGDLSGSPGESLSVNIDTGKWADFAGDARGGDPISLYAAIRGLSQGEAARELAEELEVRPAAEPTRQRRKPARDGAKPQPILPVPADAPAPTFRHGRHGQPSRTWAYRDAEGRLLGYVCRFDKPDGHKEVLPHTYTAEGWQWLSFPKPRPLYGLDQLAARPTANAVIVEGEKSADAARQLIPSAVVVTWPGGSKAVKHADWTPLHGRKVVIWPDADEPGMAAALEIAAILEGKAVGIRIALPPAGKAEGWDAANALAEEWTPETTMRWLPTALREPEDLREDAPHSNGYCAAPVEEPASTREPGDETEHDATDGVDGAALTLMGEPTLSRAALYSDDALAAIFSAEHGEDLRYVPEWGWLRWDGRRWQCVPDVAVMQVARLVCRTMATRAAADATLTQDKRTTLPKAIAAARTVAAVERLARGDPRHLAAVSDFDADPLLLTTPGGTVDLRTGELREHRRYDRITKITNATPRGACPRWQAFLVRVTDGDRPLIAYLQRLSGYSLTGLASEECLAYLYGAGANGKSTFLETLRYVLGEYATTAPMATFMESRNEQHPTDLAKLAGARLVVSQEVAEGRYWDEARIKTLTGRETISARFMRRDFFDFVPQFTLILAGNHRPSFRTVDAAIRRRVHLVPFVVQIPPEERDPNLKDVLKAEADGILAWAVEGCLAWQREGLNPPAAVLDATAAYLAEEDTVQQWLDACCVVGPGHQERSGVLYDSFRRWKEARGEGVPSQKKFTATLVDRGCRLDRVMAGRLIVGLRLNDFERARLLAATEPDRPTRDWTEGEDRP